MKLIEYIKWRLKGFYFYSGDYYSILNFYVIIRNFYS